MSKVWSQENKFQKMLDVEVAVCKVLAEEGLIPKKSFQEIKKNARFDVNKIKNIEKEIKHDIAAFVENVSSYVKTAGKYIHLGLTSSDVSDTALACQLNEATGILLEDLKKLQGSLKKQALKYKDTLMIGRTHGVHAEPTTFGLKMALFYEEANRNIRRLKEAQKVVSVGKVSGSVGTFAHLAPKIQDKVAKELSLEPATISTQVIQRDRYAELVSTIAIVGASIEKIATEIRNLQRTEVKEVEEYFSKGQKGSSSMPHKRNPVRSERLCGLARLLRGYSQSALENVALWHERDISHSSVERVILPDSTIVLDYMLAEAQDLIENLVVYSENMRKNIEQTHGLIFSQRIMLYLIEEKDLSREKAYSLVQKSAMKSFNKNRPYKKVLLENRELLKYVKPEEIEELFDYKYYLKDINTIFKKVSITK
jgi:adenylosuccinate lyase